MIHLLHKGLCKYIGKDELISFNLQMICTFNIYCPIDGGICFGLFQKRLQSRYHKGF